MERFLDNSKWRFEIEISCKNRQWLQLKNIEKFLKKTCRKIIEQTDLNSLLSKKSQVQLSISLLSSKQIQKINQKFRDINRPTDILSFSALDEEIIRNSDLKTAISDSKLVILGDLVISLEKVEKNAKSQGKFFYEHLTHLLAHGILHLIGYDHEEAKEAKKMENQEIKILQELNISNPYQI